MPVSNEELNQGQEGKQGYGQTEDRGSDGRNEGGQSEQQSDDQDGGGQRDSQCSLDHGMFLLVMLFAPRRSAAGLSSSIAHPASE